jgi:hypothetical protein
MENVEVQVQQAVGSEEAFDARELSLSEEQVDALRALSRFAEAVAPYNTRVSRFHALHYESEARVHPSSAALAAATSVIQSGLPSCPYAPPGSAVNVQYLPPNNQMVLRCHHIQPAHCWDGLGTTPYQC